MNRLSSLVENSTAVVSSVLQPSSYDKVVVVYDNIGSVVTVAANIPNINLVTTNMSSIVSNASVLEALSVIGIPVEYYTQASATLVDSTIEIRIPKGVPGANGENGLTPNYEFTYDTDTGDLSYSMVGYTTDSTTVIEEVV